MIDGLTVNGQARIDTDTTVVLLIPLGAHRLGLSINCCKNFRVGLDPPGHN